MKDIFKQGSWAFAGQALNAAAALASLKLWAVYLQPEEVGLLGLMIGFASVLVGVLIGPVTQAAVVSYADTPEEKLPLFRATVASMALRQSLIAVLLLAAGLPLAYATDTALSLPILAAGVVLIEARRTFEMSLLAARRRQKEASAIYAGDAWFRVVGLWVVLHIMGPTVQSAITGTLLGAFAFFIVSSVLLRHEGLAISWRFRRQIDRSIEHNLSQLAKPLFPALLLANVTGILNRYLIAATVGVAAAGIFIVSYSLVKRPYGLLNGVTDITMRPALASAIAQKDPVKIAHARRIWLAVGIGFAILGAILFHLLKEPIVTILLSPDYAEAIDLLPVIAVAVMLFNAASIFAGFSLVAGNSRAVLVSNAVGAVVGGALTVVLCLYFGLPGAAWALVGGYLLQLATAVHLNRPLLAPRPEAKG